MRPKNILVTGGSGFIGSAFIRYALPFCEKVVNLDLLTYAGDAARLQDLEGNPKYRFEHGDINDKKLVEKLCAEVDTIVHFAAESHVDRSIADPLLFLETNVRGTCSLLEAVRAFPHVHFHHVSTDEVYGALGPNGHFTEESLYRPNSPYAASKAASDHFVRAYAQTYKLSTTVSHCCNNYGPFQHSEKFIPHMVMKCLQNKPLPVYGNGENVRDWLYVEDHAEAIWLILNRGVKGEVYDIGADCEMRNIDLLHAIIDELSLLTKDDYRHLISFVADRPGHDFRYAIDASKIKNLLGWRPHHEMRQGLRKTILWILEENSVKLSVC